MCVPQTGNHVSASTIDSAHARRELQAVGRRNHGYASAPHHDGLVAPDCTCAKVDHMDLREREGAVRRGDVLPCCRTG